jgi:predicted dienelactone hydrolase
MKQFTSSGYFPSWIRYIAAVFWIVPTALATPSSLAAGSITAEYGIIERSLSVDSLKIYAEQGKIEPDLRPFVHLLDSTQLEQLRTLLLAKVNLSEVTVSQFLYTQQGEILLRQLGEVIRTDANLSGFYAIRSAIILAAADPDGLTLLNVLRQFPLEDVRVNLNRALQISGNLETLVRQSQSAIALVEQQSKIEVIAQPWSNRESTLNLRSPGTFTWQKFTINVNNSNRNRSFPADIYLPQTQAHVPVASAPVIVISHGLGSDRTTFAYLAEQLASYGFAVAIPEHPGSNAQQIQALVLGEVSQVMEPDEFINRPLDITALLDTLSSLSQSGSRFSGRLDLKQVGVMGQSFGGYTALALAGAQFNIQQLATDCSDQDILNVSLLLECQALALPHPTPNLQDGRVKAVLAVNPIGSNLFRASGYQNISIPVMIISGSNDTVAPSLLEQIRPFTWLETPDKYLVLLRGGTHFSTIDTSHSDGYEFDLPSAIIGPDPAIAYTYLKAMGVAFFETYVANNSSYQPYLSASYVETISQALMPIDLVRSLPSTQLRQATQN